MNRKQVLAQFNEYLKKGIFSSHETYGDFSRFVADNYQILKTNRRFNNVITDKFCPKKTTHSNIKYVMEEFKHHSEMEGLVEDTFIFGIILHRLYRKMARLYPNLTERDIEMLVRFGDDR